MAAVDANKEEFGFEAGGSVVEVGGGSGQLSTIRAVNKGADDDIRRVDKGDGTVAQDDGD